jgi:predicted SprT family Zn-dependent metalloprotease
MATATPRTKLPETGELYRLYALFRSLYFDGSLPGPADVTIEYSNRLTSSSGICYADKKIIRLSTHYHLKYPEDIPLTLLHEMIHLIVPRHDPHFKAWVRYIREMGGSVETHARERATPARYRWRYTCNSCRKKYYKARRLKYRGRYFVCSVCGGRLKEERIR